MAKPGGSTAAKVLKYASLFPIAYLSLLAGASIVHNIYKPGTSRFRFCIVGGERAWAW